MSLKQETNKIAFHDGCMLSDSATDEIVNKILDAAWTEIEGVLYSVGALYIDDVEKAINKLRGD